VWIEDDYYLLKRGVPAADPTRIPSTSFTPELNLIKPLLEQASVTHSAAAADLYSKSSGLRITFDSNRTYPLSQEMPSQVLSRSP
jgi:hypothetical protein